MERKTLPSGSAVRMTIIYFIRLPPWDTDFDRAKESGSLDCSKPPHNQSSMSKGLLYDGFSFLVARQLEDI